MAITIGTANPNNGEATYAMRLILSSSGFRYLRWRPTRFSAVRQQAHQT